MGGFLKRAAGGNRYKTGVGKKIIKGYAFEGGRVGKIT